MKLKLKVGVVICAVLMTVACLHKQSGTISPWERVMTNNAAFAQLNDDAEQGVELVQSSGFLSEAQARPILHFNAQVATAHKQVTAILAQGPASDLSQVSVLLNQIRDSGNELIATGAVGVKDPKTQQTIQADITSIIGLAQAIISDVQLAKAAKGSN